MIHPSSREHRLSAGRLELVFRWCGDRWSHCLVVHGSEGVVWESIEGPWPADGDPSWPASPPLVELSAVPSVAALVGVGRSGKSHFSVSFRAEPAGVPNGPAARPAEDSLVVECACRIQEPPGWIGSTYAGPRGLVRIPAVLDAVGAPSPLPRTITWGYRMSPSGAVPIVPFGAPHAAG